MAAYSAAQPTLVSQQATKTFLSSITNLDRSFSRELVQKFGPELYTFILDLIGKKVKTENTQFYHYEKRRRHGSAQVVSKTGGGSAGVDAVCTIAAGSHTNSGASSPGRVGEVVMASGLGVLGKITAINTSTPSAHVYTVSPLKSTDTFGIAANDWLLFQGAQHVGEKSTQLASEQPITDQVTNTVTEIREDYSITDKAAMEKIEWNDPVSGQSYYRYYGTSEGERRFLNNRELLTVFSDVVTNTTITANGTVGSKGLISQVSAGGGTFTYTAGSLAVTDIQKITRELTFNGAAPEVHMLQDVFQFQETQRMLFGLYTNGGIMWGSAGGSQEMAAAYGFVSLAIDGYSVHFKKYAPFSPEWMHGVQSATTPKYRNYGIVIPQGFAPSINGTKTPTISLRYMEQKAGQEINSYAWGGLADENKTGVMELNNTWIGYYGLEVGAANQCIILSQ